MPFPENKIYGVLNATIKKDEGEKTSKYSGMSHFNLICEVTNENSEEYQVNIDIQSSPSPNVRMLIINNFDISKAFGQKFSEIEPGFTRLDTEPDGLALDLIHQPIFNVNALKDTQPISATDISTRLEEILTDGTNVIVFGTKYDDSDHQHHKAYYHDNERYRDQHMYGARRHREQQLPPRGVDDVHLNQGTPASQYQSKDNGPYQDGALFIKHTDGTFSALFFAFASQCFNTDAKGNCIATQHTKLADSADLAESV
ncbi:DUF2278 family protein [Motiliproteus sp. MSK22-1]|uniref:DUF2278 family protein n=1 Tax=Motiliproteus sp. MSK22-1 TaxID=1897630 RepID=UPI000978AFCD|nr:DUF2278 family protein [Motiliproteus sp. MSK22-1]OMH33973.1 hypothetical protein BGP75_13490 [Motiliproteus sp. MSK22-1]